MLVNVVSGFSRTKNGPPEGGHYEYETAYFFRPEYSSICVVRSNGYEILTSVT